MHMKTVIKEYIRDEKRNPIGVVVAVRIGNDVNYGYSLCAPGDKFNKGLGEHIATKRASLDVVNLPEVDGRYNKVTTALLRLSNRAVRFFKDIPKERVEIGAFLND